MKIGSIGNIKKVTVRLKISETLDLIPFNFDLFFIKLYNKIENKS